MLTVCVFKLSEAGGIESSTELNPYPHLLLKAKPPTRTKRFSKGLELLYASIENPLYLPYLLI